jgi:hypothetical protein
MRTPAWQKCRPNRKYNHIKQRRLGKLDPLWFSAEEVQ